MTTALGAGFILALAVAAEACDERYPQNCETAPAAAATETEPAAAPAAQGPRPQVRRAGRAERPRGRDAARAEAGRPEAGREERRAAPKAEAVTKAKGEAGPSPAVPAAMRETALERRFRGFIDPRTMAENMFENLRPAQVDASHLALAALPFAAPLAAVESVSVAAAAPSRPPPPAPVSKAPMAAAASASALADTAPVAVVEAEPLRRPPSDSSGDAATMRGLVLALGVALAAAAVVGVVTRA